MLSTDSAVGTAAPLKKKVCVPVRDLLDVVATNDVVSLAIAVEGYNPHDESPGMKRILRAAADRSALASDGAEKTLMHTVDAVRQFNTMVEYDQSTFSLEDPGCSSSKEKPCFIAVHEVRDGVTGNTALHIACSHGHVAITDVLLENPLCFFGHEIGELRNKAGFTPFHLAAAGGHTAVMELLLQKGKCSSKAPALVLTGVAAPSHLSSSPIAPAARPPFRTALFIALAAKQHKAVAWLLHQPDVQHVFVVSSDATSQHPSTVPATLLQDNGVRHPLAALMDADPTYFAALFDFLDCASFPATKLEVRKRVRGAALIAEWFASVQLSTPHPVLSTLAAQSSAGAVSDAAESVQAWVLEQLLHRKLIRSGESVGVGSEAGWSALQCFAAHNHTHLVEALVLHGPPSFIASQLLQGDTNTTGVPALVQPLPSSLVSEDTASQQQQQQQRLRTMLATLEKRTLLQAMLSNYHSLPPKNRKAHAQQIKALMEAVEA